MMMINSFLQHMNGKFSAYAVVSKRQVHKQAHDSAWFLLYSDASPQIFLSDLVHPLNKVVNRQHETNLKSCCA
jgi:hypothetical protein